MNDELFSERAPFPLVVPTFAHLNNIPSRLKPPPSLNYFVTYSLFDILFRSLAFIHTLAFSSSYSLSLLRPLLACRTSSPSSSSSNAWSS